MRTIHRARKLARMGAALAVAALAAPLGAGALPLLSEVFYDAAGSDDGRSFVEIAGLPGTDLGGLVVEGINGSNGAVTDSIALSGQIGADGLFLLADDAGDGTSFVADADLIADFDFQKGDQAQAKSRAYAADGPWIPPGCATAQSCVCQ